MYGKVISIFRFAKNYIKEKLATEVFYLPTGVVKTVFYDKHDNYHRDGDKPAVIGCCESTGAVLYQHYYQHGQLHRENDKPAYVRYNLTTGKISLEEYYVNGQQHRASGKPTHISYDSSGAIKFESFVDEHGTHARGVLYNQSSGHYNKPHTPT